MVIGVLIRGEYEIPGKSIYKLEQSILNDSWRLHDYRAGPDNVHVFVFFGEKNGTVGGYKTGSVGKL